MKHFKNIALAGAMAMGGLAPMSAAALNLTHEGPPISDLSANYPSVDTSNEGSVPSGGFEMAERDGSGNVIDTFLAWCFEVEKTLDFSSNASYTVGGVLDTAARGRVQTMFDANYSDDGSFFTDRDKSAAFQLAIWEAIYETTATTFDLSGGAFTSTTTGGTSGIGFLADGFLTAANNYTDGQEWIITEYKNDDANKQGIGTVNAIPLPAAAWLLLGVSGGLIAAKRRQARRAA